VAAVAIVPGIRTSDIERPVQSERHKTFSWHADLASFGHGLADRTCACASNGTDRRPFSAAGNCSDDASDYSAAADIFTGTRIRAHPFFLTVHAYRLVGSADYIPPAIYVDGFEIEYDVAIVSVAHDKFCIRTTRNDYIAGSVSHVPIYHPSVDSAFV